MANETVLRIDNLTVAYADNDRWLDAVREFSLTIAAGETVGLVGESGSGKSTIALAIMRYLGEGGRVRSGTIWFDGRDLLTLPPAELRRLWGHAIALVPQNPQASLNPSLRIATQLSEPLEHHLGLGRAAAARRVLELLEMVRIADPARVARSYPHQISGGMQQRVLIALALSTEPRLLVLDEPTTSLDVTSQASFLDLLADLIRVRNTAVLYVTHNLGVVAQVCDRVAVLYAGEQVEAGETAPIFRRPIHPYTVGLLESVPQIGQGKAQVTLRAIPGQIPALRDRAPQGCIFAARCPVVLDRCRAERPPLVALPTGGAVRCHRWPEIVDGSLALFAPAAPPPPASAAHAERPLLALDAVEVHFDLPRSLEDVIRQRPAEAVRAVDGVSLAIDGGRTLGIVGESGSGKTTLARAVIGLYARTGGTIELLGAALPATLGARTRAMLRNVQYVFQNPDEALNPYLTVGETLRRPLITLLGQSDAVATQAVARLLDAVRLPADYAERLPSQLSGGEKQRVAIARAFASQPDLLLADEPVSALDVSVQASVLNLLRDMQREMTSTLVLISHDLAVVGYLADEIAVMYVGHLLEVAPSQALFHPPHHPYTEALLSAIPDTDPDKPRNAIRLTGDVPRQVERISPQAAERAAGCPFHARCPRYLGDLCRDVAPPWQTAADGTRIYCHIPLDQLAALQTTRPAGR